MAKRILKYFILPAVLFTVIFSAAVDISMSAGAASDVYDSFVKLPENRCGLLLGTSKYRVEGGINPYFRNRLEAAVKLFNAGKISYIIASGDNSEKYYNEPRQMKNFLIKMGVPKEKIYMDFAGFRTLDSVIRAKYIFGQTALTVISQKFHIERAIYIGKRNGMEISGFVADDVKEGSYFNVRLREVFARVKAFVDMNMIGKQPRFLGKKIEIH